MKTAFAGEDANWGRIVMAVGKADEPIDRDSLSVKFGPLVAAQDGLIALIDGATLKGVRRLPCSLVIRESCGDGRRHRQ